MIITEKWDEVLAAEYEKPYFKNLMDAAIAITRAKKFTPRAL